MMRILFVFAALLCVANALVQSGLPMKSARSPPRADDPRRAHTWPEAASGR